MRTGLCSAHRDGEDRTCPSCYPCEGCNGSGTTLNYFGASDWFEQECSHCGGSGNAKDIEP